MTTESGSGPHQRKLEEKGGPPGRGSEKKRQSTPKEIGVGTKRDYLRGYWKRKRWCCFGDECS